MGYPNIGWTPQWDSQAVKCEHDLRAVQMAMERSDWLVRMRGPTDVRVLINPWGNAKTNSCDMLRHVAYGPKTPAQAQPHAL